MSPIPLMISVALILLLLVATVATDEADHAAPRQTLPPIGPARHTTAAPTPRRSPFRPPPL